MLVFEWSLLGSTRHPNTGPFKNQTKIVNLSGFGMVQRANFYSWTKFTSNTLKSHTQFGEAFLKEFLETTSSLLIKYEFF
jgi:hypothetical protein